MSVTTNLLPPNVAEVETDTSGWTAGANTALFKSTRYYTGAASLGMTATAAGSVTATTTARVAVTAGLEYTAYTYAAGVTATAGRTAQIRVDWYAAISGGTALGTATSTAVALPNATTWIGPPTVLVATAPAGARYAAVTVTVTGLAAAGQAVVDAIAFGRPNTPTYNLLPYNVASAEIDTSGWRTYGTATLTRDSTRAYEGWYSMVVGSTAAGTAGIETSDVHPVTPGTEYLAYSYVYASATSTHRAIIQWVDAAGATTDVAQTWSVLASTWTRCMVAGVAPPGAVAARVRLEAEFVDTAQTLRTDQVVMRVAPTPTGSLLNYNGYSIEIDTAEWVAVSGCTISRSLETAWEGMASLRIDPTGGTAVVGLAHRVPVIPRQAYQVSPRVKVGASSLPTRADIRFTWYATDGSLVRHFAFTWTLNPGTGGWYNPKSAYVAPPGAAELDVQIAVLDRTADQPVWIDNVEITPGGLALFAEPIPGAYGIAIQAQGLTDGGLTYWGLWRMAEDGAMRPVRGPSGDLTQMEITGSTATAEDYEAPLGVPVTYYLRLWTTPTSNRPAVSDPVTIPAPPDTEIVLKDPGLPARQTTAVVAAGGRPTWTRKARQGVNAIRGRARPIVISDVRASREGTLTLVTESAGDSAGLWWLLETGNPLLLQWPTIFGEDDVYVTVGDVAEAPIVDYAGYTDRTWTLPLTEVDRPIGGAAGSAGRTWQTVATDHPDWLDVLSTYSSWLGVYTGEEGS
ncbi:carbohydrate binding domain-containing protein [Streptomyces sp. NPDC056061]|uniref:carbohydrate binding domain-containing protein n=1 Tax=Streptomyces sp. NPDC056061 TaxID=3345700 RepID=UPI0035D703D5